MMKELPEFFKVFIPSPNPERLSIPSAFVEKVKALKGAIPNVSFLRNRQGTLWPTKVIKVGTDIYFLDGWGKFVEDNSLQHGEFLVFHFDGKSTFDFKILGRDACEKSYLDFKVKEEAEEDEDEDEDEEEEEDEYDDEDEDEEYNEEVPDSTIEDTDEEELEAKTLRKKIEKGEGEKSSKGLKKVKRGTNYGYKGKSVVKAEIGYNRAGETDMEDDADIFKYGMVSRPKNPYFVTKRRATRQNELYIPKEVIRDHRLKLPENLKIVDEEGREWSSVVKVWKDGRIWLTGASGWKAFCKWNNFEEQDRCICEFDQGPGQQGIFLKTCILRKDSWLCPR